MKFRPCIDLHQGKVKQIVGESLNVDNDKEVIENFVSEQEPAYYADMFKRDHLLGGHVIMLGGGNEEAAHQALQAYPRGLHIGGGITAENAASYLAKGASHVIVTSYIFRDGELNTANLDKIVSEVGADKLVIDLSCKEHNGKWVVATNQWKTISNFEVTAQSLRYLEAYCDEFLVHAVDVEGKRAGIQESLVKHLAQSVTIPTTYAGGARSIADLELFHKLTDGKLDITIGSALDIFGGSLPYKDVITYCSNL
ncbi:phosphoribosylformimino-5-aminoimidazole carboxamide ribotide isomerase [Paenibacillus radicis (ex Xue et al. 2023)]|uniref:Phosphoribosylformimino-5-aminoimidazole carboxamide ribotide isomerase n=1 Tax=Paenibacillus radicis (ex Xue et al. 2023) TaxID=2972489 RepID=A0ABT1YK93_9BACL|nr:phosphoribosylformimino-5-aminoimidazole carboxamide ribotide isomerase [Paenibacillus radicis (ex Xue et al. 2023)]MCR8632683.1 phosphoribosylformimino-5-aminoimidazole carboxamide ribotide isomerase [Paenibacillus radicis (ex Xue et al. 2023)]